MIKKIFGGRYGQAFSRLIGTSFLAFALSAPAHAKFVDMEWDGVWVGPNGDTLRLWQNGSEVLGYYGSAGFFYGYSNGDRLRGIFTVQDRETKVYAGDVDPGMADQDDGVFELELSKDGKTFKGNWAFGPNPGDWTGQWTGGLNKPVPVGRFRGHGGFKMMEASAKLDPSNPFATLMWAQDVGPRPAARQLTRQGWSADDPFGGVWSVHLKSGSYDGGILELDLKSSDSVEPYGFLSPTKTRLLTGKMNVTGRSSSRQTSDRYIFGFSTTDRQGLAEARMFWFEPGKELDGKAGFLELAIDTKTGKPIYKSTPINKRLGISKGFFGAGSHDKIGNQHEFLYLLERNKNQYNTARYVDAFSRRMGWDETPSRNNPIIRTLIDPATYNHDDLRAKIQRDLKKVAQRRDNEARTISNASESQLATRTSSITGETSRATTDNRPTVLRNAPQSFQPRWLEVDIDRLEFHSTAYNVLGEGFYGVLGVRLNCMDSGQATGIPASGGQTARIIDIPRKSHFSATYSGKKRSLTIDRTRRYKFPLECLEAPRPRVQLHIAGTLSERIRVRGDYKYGYQSAVLWLDDISTDGATYTSEGSLSIPFKKSSNLVGSGKQHWTVYGEMRITE